jgi:hypothetical protein
MDADADGYLDAARPDLREIAAGRPAPTKEDDVRVPEADEAAASLAWAKQVLDEVDARTAADARLANAMPTSAAGTPTITPTIWGSRRSTGTTLRSTTSTRRRSARFHGRGSHRGR